MATLAEAFVRTFLPASCALCQQPLPWQGSAAGVCAACWASVGEQTSACPRCGEPAAGADGLCLECAEAPPPWRAAASFGPYAGALRELVLLLKTRKRDELASPLAALLARTWRRARWPAPRAVVAVPMWWGRRLVRGFNQAELLARAVAPAVGAPFVAALARRRGRRQTGRGGRERRRLPAAAFSARRPLAGAVLLIDDVLTTGATAAACTRTLLAAGAADVYVLTLARTVRPGRIP